MTFDPFWKKQESGKPEESVAEFFERVKKQYPPVFARCMKTMEEDPIVAAKAVILTEKFAKDFSGDPEAPTPLVFLCCSILLASTAVDILRERDTDGQTESE